MDAPAPRPDRIGPYRLEGRLGVGGMGEVYRAYDERLGRWVAIKLIRPDVAGHEKARERFRREARAAACLNHRAIVQIHDILQSDAGDAIVMEIVEGPTLADRLSSGPLDLSSALRIALTIAEGLAAAHAEGLVHRDLKTENVVITPAGDAKILDFGLAKRFRRTDEEANLTIDGALVGTRKAMSPEQARCWRVDHRSDLFSFGTLLYEMLTGQPPFTGEDILTKICTWQPPPVRVLNPEVPEALSDLIERLMEKDCSRRPQSAEKVVGALGEIAGMPAGNHTWAALPTVSDGGPTMVDDPRRGRNPGLSLGKHRSLSWERFLLKRWSLPIVAGMVLLTGLLVLMLRSKPFYVAVPTPQILRKGTDRRVELLAHEVQGALVNGLASRKGISPIPVKEEVSAAHPAVAVARAVSAAEVLDSEFDCDIKTCLINLRRIRSSDGSVLKRQSFSLPNNELDSTNVSKLDESVNEQIANIYSDHTALLSPDLRIKPKSRSVDEVITKLTEIRQGSPESPPPLDTLLLEARLRKHLYILRRDVEDVDQAIEVLEHAHEIAPEDPRPLLAWFDLDLLAEKLDDAERPLAKLETILPESKVGKIYRLRLKFKRGKEPAAKQAAIRSMRELAQQEPIEESLYYLVYMEKQLGEADNALDDLRVIVKSFPASSVARSQLAELELGYGSPQNVIKIYQNLEQSSLEVRELTNLGTAYLMVPDYPAAEQTLQRAYNLARNEPAVALNLADALALQKKEPLARYMYTNVLELTKHVEDTEDPKQWTIRAQAQAQLGQKDEARRSIDNALNMPGVENDVEVLYEISLVYTLIGEYGRASDDATKSFRSGMAPGWFNFPWFSDLKKEKPGFERELRAHPAGYIH